MVPKERFGQGMTFQQYCDQMGTNKDKNPDLMDQYLNQGMFRSITWRGGVVKKIRSRLKA
jgi:hypothetical protein